MVSREQKVRVGIFFIIGILLVTLLFSITLGRTLFREQKIYHIKFQNTSVSGLDVGGNVKYHGINVGEIKDIEVSKEGDEDRTGHGHEHVDGESGWEAGERRRTDYS